MTIKPFVCFLVLTVCAFSTATASGQRVIRVIDAKTHAGVKSEVFKTSNTRTESSLGMTDNDGVKIIDSAGRQGEKVRAQPENPRYYSSSLAACPLKPGQTLLEVPPVDALGYQAKALLAQAQRAEMDGKPAEAALKFKEFANAVARSDPALAQFSEKKVAELGGDVFDVLAPVRVKPDQTTWTTSSPLVEKVKDFQRESGLSATGTLDKQTLAKAAARERERTQTATTSEPH
jgi:Putative peptidoglycan binding domain